MQTLYYSFNQEISFMGDFIVLKFNRDKRE